MITLHCDRHKNIIEAIAATAQMVIIIKFCERLKYAFFWFYVSLLQFVGNRREIFFKMTLQNNFALPYTTGLLHDLLYRRYNII